jgi:hypothetical protein
MGSGGSFYRRDERDKYIGFAYIQFKSGKRNRALSP